MTDSRRSRFAEAVRGPFVPVWVATALLFVVSPIVAPGSLSSSAILSMLPFAAIVAIAAFGQTLVVQQGGLDLSVAGMVSLAACLVTTQSRLQDDRLVLALLLVLAVAVAAGLVSGIAVTRFGITPLVATLAVNALLLGCVLAISGSTPTAAPRGLTGFALDKTLGVPNTVIIAVVVVALGTLVLRRTVVGRRFEAVGTSPRSALAAGIAVPRYQLGAYVIASVASAAAGVLLAGYVQTPGLFVGDAYLFPAIAAVVIGGTWLTGGRGSLVASAVGALFLTQLAQLVLSIGAPTSAQFLIQAAAIAVGVAMRTVPWSSVASSLRRPPGRRPASSVVPS